MGLGLGFLFSCASLCFPRFLLLTGISYISLGFSVISIVSTEICEIIKYMNDKAYDLMYTSFDPIQIVLFLLITSKFNNEIY